MAGERLRVDKWLWAARFFKTRSLAAAAAGKGRITVNGQPAKPAREIAGGDRLFIDNGETRWEVIVCALAERRGPASEARLLYTETPESLAAREAARQHRSFSSEPASAIHGRPTKRDRRQLSRLAGTQ